MLVSVKYCASRVRIIAAPTGVLGLVISLTMAAMPVAYGFKGQAMSEPTIEPTAVPDRVGDNRQKHRAPAAAGCLPDVRRTTTGPTRDPVCRTRYNGVQPGFAVPPAYVVDAPLPSIYCGNVNQWVFLYPARTGTQFYRLDPSKQESYRVIFSDAAKGTMAPWALRKLRAGEITYFVNVEPARTGTFDYTVSDRFDVCLELAALPGLKIALLENAEECR